jgi:hypothetical protein
MGFNPRLAPYSVTKEVNYQTNTDTDTFALDHFLLRMPFAGQLLGAYAALGQGGGPVVADTTTALWEVSIWKNSVDNTTATYATGDRAAKRTGAVNQTGAIAWAANTVYALTNQTGVRRSFDAGDKLYLRTAFTAAVTHGTIFGFPQEKLEIQMDYVIGQETGSTPSAATGPA